jgi:hypothetical protein
MARHQKIQYLRENIAIVGDGQTERIYLSDVRDTDRPSNIALLPDYPRKIGSFQGVLQRASELKDDYSKVFALIDMDKIIQENQQAAYQIVKNEVQEKGVIVLENNPCFEIWLLLHFVKTGKIFTSCNDVVSELRKYIPNYDKSQKFLKNANLYNNYKELLKDKAIANAIFLEKDRDHKDPSFPRAEVFRFFEWYFEKLKEKQN